MTAGGCSVSYRSQRVKAASWVPGQLSRAQRLSVSNPPPGGRSLSQRWHKWGFETRMFFFTWILTCLWALDTGGCKWLREVHPFRTVPGAVRCKPSLGQHPPSSTPPTSPPKQRRYQNIPVISKWKHPFEFSEFQILGSQRHIVNSRNSTGYRSGALTRPKSNWRHHPKSSFQCFLLSENIPCSKPYQRVEGRGDKGPKPEHAKNWQSPIIPNPFSRWICFSASFEMG